MGVDKRRYPYEAILEAIAIFDGKKAATLPKDVDARYLLGIARNIAEQREGMAIAEALLKARIELRDASLTQLEREQLRLQNDRDDEEILKDFLDHALKAGRSIDRLFSFSPPPTSSPTSTTTPIANAISSTSPPGASTPPSPSPTKNASRPPASSSPRSCLSPETYAKAGPSPLTNRLRTAFAPCQTGKPQYSRFKQLPSL